MNSPACRDACLPSSSFSSQSLSTREKSPVALIQVLRSLSTILSTHILKSSKSKIRCTGNNKVDGKEGKNRGTGMEQSVTQSYNYWCDVTGKRHQQHQHNLERYNWFHNRSFCFLKSIFIIYFWMLEFYLWVRLLMAKWNTHPIWSSTY